MNNNKENSNKKVVQAQVSTAKNQFIETSTQTIDNTGFLMMGFLHIYEKEKQKWKNI